MSLQRSIATPIQKPYTAKLHHAADGVCDAAADVAGAASSFAWIAFAGTCFAAGYPNSGVADVCITALAGAVATIGLVRVFDKASRYVRDSTNVYAGDISDKIASQFNQVGHGLAWVAPLTFVVAAGAVASHYLHKLPQAHKTDESCQLIETPNAVGGKRVFEVSKDCKKSTFELK